MKISISTNSRALWGIKLQNRASALRKLLCAVLTAGCITASVGALEPTPPAFAPGELLIKLKPPQPGKLRASAASLIPDAEAVSGTLGNGWQLLRLPEGLSVGDAIEMLKDREAVEFAEPNYRYQIPRPLQSAGGPAAHSAMAAPEAEVPAADDPLYPRLYGLDHISAPAAWKHTTGSEEVVIAVFDTGVDYTHPDLAPNMWRNPGEIPENRRDDDRNGFTDDIHGVNVVNGSGDPIDHSGHGTHVAGTIGAAGNNGIGVAGVNWKVKILPVCVAREDGAFTGDLVRGLDYLTALKKRGVNVVAVNHSWGGIWPSRALFEAFGRLADAGVVHVCAAGNFRRDHLLVPEFPVDFQLPSLIRVAASNPADQLAWFTDYGSEIHLSAPGQYVYSCIPGNRYEPRSGTSMATPHVTGALGLLFAMKPDLTAEQARLLLMHTADPLPAFDRDRVMSGGRLNIGRAIEWLAEERPLPSSFTPPRPAGHRFQIASRGPEGFDSDAPSTNAVVSENGRYIAFVSRATNLTSTRVTSRQLNIFLADRELRQNVLVTRLPSGENANGSSFLPAISADGSFIAFTTTARNLAPDDLDPVKDVVLWERETGSFILLSKSPAGEPKRPSENPSISGDGRRVAFESTARLLPEDQNTVRDVYVWDSEEGLMLASINTNNLSVFRPSTDPALSSDGRWVVFASAAPGLAPGDGNGIMDIFVRELSTGQTERASLSGTGSEANASSSRPRISADGRFVAFQSRANNLDAGSPPAAFTSGTGWNKRLASSHFHQQAPRFHRRYSWRRSPLMGAGCFSAPIPRNCHPARGQASSGCLPMTGSPGMFPRWP